MIQNQLTNLILSLEKARTKTTIPAGTKLVKKDVGQSVPKGLATKKMAGGAEYVPAKSVGKTTEGKTQVYWQGEGKGFPVRYINPGSPMPEGYGPSPKVKQDDSKGKQVGKQVKQLQDKIKIKKEELTPKTDQVETSASVSNRQASNIVSYEDTIANLKDAIEEINKKIENEKDPNKIQELLIIESLLIGTHFEIIQNRGKVSGVVGDIEGSFNNIDPKDLRSLSDLEKYVEVGKNKLSDGELIDMNKFGRAQRALSQAQEAIVKKASDEFKKESDIEGRRYQEEAKSLIKEYTPYKHKNPILPTFDDMDMKLFTELLKEEYKNHEVDIPPSQISNILIDRNTVVTGNTKISNLVDFEPLTMLITPKRAKDMKDIEELLLKNMWQNNKDNYKMNIEKVTSDGVEKLKVLAIPDVIAHGGNALVPGSNVEATNSSGATPQISVSNKSFNGILKNIKKKYDASSSSDKMFPYRVLPNGSLIRMDASANNNNVTFIDGAQGGGKTNMFKMNLIKALTLDDPNKYKITMIDPSGKYNSTPEMQALIQKAKDKGLFEDPLEGIEDLSNMNDEKVETVMNKMSSYFTKVFSQQATFLQAGGVDRIELNKKTETPFYDIYLDEFQNFVNKTINGVQDKTKREILSNKLTGIISRVGTEGKKHGIYLTPMTQGAVNDEKIKDMIRNTRKDLIALNPVQDPFAYAKNQRGFAALDNTMRDNPNGVAFLPDSDVRTEKVKGKEYAKSGTVTEKMSPITSEMLDKYTKSAT